MGDLCMPEVCPSGVGLLLEAGLMPAAQPSWPYLTASAHTAHTRSLTHSHTPVYICVHLAVCHVTSFCLHVCVNNQVGLFSLGIIPYINASIVLQLMSAAFPALKKMQREDGPQGRARFQYYQKLAAFVFAIAQVTNNTTRANEREREKGAHA